MSEKREGLLSDVQLWEGFCKVKEDEEFLAVFQSVKGPLEDSKNLKKLILKTKDVIGDCFNFDVETFTQKGEGNDELDLKNLTFKVYQRRIGNLILAQLFKNLKNQNSLEEFIKQSWNSSSAPKDLEELNLGSYIDSISNLSIPFHLPNASGIDENSLLADPKPSNQEASPIKVTEEYKHSPSIPISNVNESPNRSIQASLPQIVVKAADEGLVEEQDSPEIKNPERLNEKNWLLSGNNNVIKELSERSDSSNFKEPDFEFESPNYSFAGQVTTTKQAILLKSIEGLSSYIRKNSDSEYSDLDEHRNIFEIISNEGLKKKGRELKEKKGWEGSRTEGLEDSLKSEESFESTEEAIKTQEEEEEEDEQWGRDKNPWFTVSISGKEHEFYKIFKKLAGGEFANLTVLHLVLEKTLKKLRIAVFEHHREIFKRIYEGLYSGKLIKSGKVHGKSGKIKVNFHEFVEIMNLWGNKYQQEQKTVLGSVIRTSCQMDSLHKAFYDMGPLSDILDYTIFQIKKTVNEFASYKKSEESVEESQKKNLDEIFSFYGKIQKIQGIEPTFEALEASNTTWNLGKFLKFCSDFQIISTKNDLKRGASKESLTTIFKKIAENTRVMNFSQFLEALTKISELLYSPELDQKLQTNFAYKSTSEKRLLLYNLLEISNFSKIQLKKKPFGPGFIPENSAKPSKTDRVCTYKSNPIKKTEQDLLTRRLSKPKIFNSPKQKQLPKLLSPQPALKSNMQIFHPSSYLSRFKSSNPLKLTSMSPKPPVLKEELSNKIVYKSLTTLMSLDMEPDDSLKALIFEDFDEGLEESLKLDPKLVKMIKVHNSQLARGLKVLNKYR